jgi:hypothetical protein
MYNTIVSEWGGSGASENGRERLKLYKTLIVDTKIPSLSRWLVIIKKSFMLFFSRALSHHASLAVVVMVVGWWEEERGKKFSNYTDGGMLNTFSVWKKNSITYEKSLRFSTTI